MLVWSRAWTLHLPQCSAAWAYQMRLTVYTICQAIHTASVSLSFFLMTNWEQDLILNTSDCWFSLPHFLIKFYLISLSILIHCLLDNVRILSGEVTCLSLIGVKGLLLFPDSLTNSNQTPWNSLSFGMDTRIYLKLNSNSFLLPFCLSVINHPLT